MMQTVEQQLESLQPAASCVSLQLPAPGAPQPTHSAFASFTHWASHATLQHPGSVAQTTSQHAPSRQDPELCATKQLSATEPHAVQNFSASETHNASHATAQHMGSIAQTVEQQFGFEHPASVIDGEKQLWVELAHTACAETFALSARQQNRLARRRSRGRDRMERMVKDRGTKLASGVMVSRECAQRPHQVRHRC